MSEYAKSGQDACQCEAGTFPSIHVHVLQHNGLCIAACVQIPGLTWYDYVKMLVILGCILVYR